MRTVIQLTDEQIAALRALCERKGISRAEAIRQAVDRLVEDEAADAGAREKAFREAFGIWKPDRRDSLDILEELRSEWHRPAFGSWAGRAGDGVDFQQRIRGEWDDR